VRVQFRSQNIGPRRWDGTQDLQSSQIARRCSSNVASACSSSLS
jgi:hypothetical protein